MKTWHVITTPYGIGEHLITRLLENKEPVFTVFPSPKDVPMTFLGKMNLKYGFLRFDRDTDFYKVLPKKVDTVFHLFDQYSGPNTMVFRSNIYATLLLLDWARRVGVRKFIYLSSGEIYGQGKDLNEHSPFKPGSFYATTKFETEILFKYYKKGPPISILRIFHPFGKSENNGYIRHLAEAVKNKDAIKGYYGTISPTYVNDLIDPLLNLRAKKEAGSYNCGGSAVNTKTLIEKVKVITKASPKNISIGKAELISDSTKAKKELGYSETPLDKALQDSFAE